MRQILQVKFLNKDAKNSEKDISTLFLVFIVVYKSGPSQVGIKYRDLFHYVTVRFAVLRS